ncbi:MAG: M61 family metallopeptidase [Gemmatimonadaceae bacterium]
MLRTPLRAAALAVVATCSPVGVATVVVTSTAIASIAMAPSVASAQRPTTRPAAPAARTGRAAQPTSAVSYQVDFPNAVHHEARVQATFPAVPRGRPLELRMSRSSPGRYALHEFAKNVYDVKATDGRGRELRITRPSPYQWDVAGHDGTVNVTYTVFGDRADGTYMAVDRNHAHLNAPALFMWARGLERRPARVAFRGGRPDWRIATQLAPTGDSAVFTAPHLQYLMDSPIELSAHEVHSWKVTSGGRTQEIRIALHHAGSEADAAAYVDGARRITEAAERVWGALPRFDYGSYTFLADYLPWTSGDGMEPRNSTVVSSSRPLSTGLLANLGTVSHEFFHAWNVERLRPADLEPFDFTGADMSDNLWLAEGFTQYYGSLLLRRAGLTSDTAYAQTVGAIANAVINGGGRRFFSPVGMSQQAPFVDAATSVDPQNKANTFISYYTWGAGVALALDLELRQRHASSLDAYMRAMWERHGQHQADNAPARPYTTADARRTLGAVARDTAWANAFFARYVTGQDAPDYAALLAPAGILLRPVSPDAAWLGDARWDADSAVALSSPAIIGTPLYDAGMEQGDVLLSLGGRAIATPADVATLLAAHKPGDALPITFESRGNRREATIALAASPRLEAVLFEQAGRPVTPQMRALRGAWLK